MMQVLFQNNPQDFIDKCGAYLTAHEAEHNLMLSLCQAALQKVEKGDDANLHCFSLSDESGLVLAAIQTPPHNLVLSRATATDIEQLTDLLANQNAVFPGIIGPSDVAAAFAESWALKTSQKSVEYMDQIIYALTSVRMPAATPAGAFRAARPEEAGLIGSWLQDFSVKVLPKAEHVDLAAAEKRAGELIAAERICVWAVDDKPVSQAAVSGTKNVARMSAVYTPDEHRGHGYASAVVAHLSQRELDKGCKMCCLYADARNTVSNAIYRKIGYEFVGRSSMYILDKPRA